MAKRVQVESNGKQYVLEFAVGGIKKIEDMGFKQGEAFQSIVSSAQLLLYGALIKHQPNVNPNLAAKILESLLADGYELTDLAEVLLELHQDALHPNVPTGGKKVLEIVEDI